MMNVVTGIWPVQPDRAAAGRAGRFTATGDCIVCVHADRNDHGNQLQYSDVSIHASYTRRTGEHFFIRTELVGTFIPNYV